MPLVGVVQNFNFETFFFLFLQLWTSENQGDEGDAGEGEN